MASNVETVSMEWRLNISHNTTPLRETEHNVINEISVIDENIQTSSHWINCIPVDTRRHNKVIITSKRRRNVVYRTNCVIIVGCARCDAVFMSYYKNL